MSVIPISTSPLTTRSNGHVDNCRIRFASYGAIGKVVRLDPLGEFGKLESSDGQEIYFHRNSVLRGDYARLVVGSRVTYAEEMGEKGPQASTVKLMGKHILRV